jgi:hypothetical protein
MLATPVQDQVAPSRDRPALGLRAFYAAAGVGLLQVALQEHPRRSP